MISIFTTLGIHFGPLGPKIGLILAGYAEYYSFSPLSGLFHPQLKPLRGLIVATIGPLWAFSRPLWGLYKAPIRPTVGPYRALSKAYKGLYGGPMGPY